MLISHFNPRSPWGERPKQLVHFSNININFNPRSPWGERLGNGIIKRLLNIYFNPRSPWGERLAASIKSRCSSLDFNPRSPWGERHILDWIDTPVFLISIHALREESDLSSNSCLTFLNIFQSTLSVRRATLKLFQIMEHTILFQSTLSVRRATFSSF